MVIFCIFFTQAEASNIRDVEYIKKHIIETLKKKNPVALGEFDIFCRRYDQLVISFFDKKNNCSLQQHIQHMERELNFLRCVSEDKKFSCVLPYLKEYEGYIGELIEILKKYVGSHDALTLAFKVRKFKFLLPTPVKKRSDLSLLWALRHRLLCTKAQCP